jgi:hypothetical protein
MKEIKRSTKVLPVRIPDYMHEFYISHPGLSARVLKDFHNQWDDMMYKERKLEEKQAAEKKKQDK